VTSARSGQSSQPQHVSLTPFHDPRIFLTY
jgi:hypothetical protein